MMKRIPLNFDWKRTMDSDLPFFLRKGEGEAVDLPDDFVLNLTRDKDAPGGASVGFFP